MTQATPQLIATQRLSSSYLEEVATKAALFDTESDALIQGIAFSCLEQLVHFLFCYVFYVFYPAYEQFYYEKQVEAFDKANKPLPPYASSTWSEAVLFFHRCLANPCSIGSIFPSSFSLVEGITSKIPARSHKGPPQMYLDIGAGTGSFTDEIVRKMRPIDHLDVVEYDSDLCKLLRRKFHHLKNVTVHEISIIDFNPGRKYDVIVSGLPVTVFPPHLATKALNKYEELAKPGGSLSYFEYFVVPKIIKAILCGKACEDFCSVIQLKENFAERFKAVKDSALLNVPPARILHFQMP